MTTIRQTIEERADKLLDKVYALKQLRKTMEESAPELLDLDVESWVTLSPWTGGGSVNISATENAERNLGVTLLGLAGEDRVVKEETWNDDMKATFDFGDVKVRLTRPTKKQPCQTYQVRDKRVSTISVCGEVDLDRYEIVKDVADHVDYDALKAAVAEAA